MSIVITENTVMHDITCCNCEMRFFVPEAFKERRQNDRRSFYCPAGHSLRFTGETTEERLRRLLNAAELDKTRLTNELEAKKKSLTSVATRIANGVCPCCNRTFKALQAHMQRKHPEYQK